MKIILTLFIAVFSCNSSYSQVIISELFNPTLAREMAISNSNRNSKISGSPYIVTVFTTGFVGENKQPFLLRYNAESDAIELKFDEENIYIIPKETKFTNIVIGVNRYKLLNYTDLKGQFINGYLIEKTNGTVALFKREKIVIKPEKIATTSYETSEPAKFIRGSDEYYLKLKDNTIVAFPKNKKGILELFPAQKQAIEDFVKTNKTSFSNEQDLVKLTQFITGLLVE